MLSDAIVIMIGGMGTTEYCAGALVKPSYFQFMCMSYPQSYPRDWSMSLTIYPKRCAIPASQRVWSARADFCP